MKTLTICEARSRTDTQLTPHTYTWSELIDKLRIPRRTNETMSEYAGMTKTQQTNIKDVGGYVGGRLQNGVRSGQTVLDRVLAVIDADNASPNVAEALKSAFNCAAVIHPTHRSTPDKLRLRIIILLSRLVKPDEYAPLVRYIMHQIGDAQCDPTSVETARLMFWPSVPKDAPYELQVLEGAPLDVDAVLAQCGNWQDLSRLGVPKSALKQADPAKKDGLIGAFCRAYSIEDAIREFLPEVYIPTGAPNRWTYAAGSTTGGAIVYDEGRFLYSHHATDPVGADAGSHCVNAFDLVRIHKFRLQDAAVKPGTPHNRLPSFVAMQELASGLPKVREQLYTAKLEQAREEFEDIPEESASAGAGNPDPAWQMGISIDKGGTAKPTMSNLTYIITNDPKLSGSLAFNELADCIVSVRDLPWHTNEDPVNGDQWTDVDDIRMLQYLERYNERLSKNRVADAVSSVAAAHKFQPVCEYLKSLSWDGVPRLETLFMDRLGVEDSPYARAVTRKALVGAVARAFEPGCKMDYMLVLVGEQGYGKSSILRDLSRGWFQDNIFGIGDKTAMEQLQGKWIIEMSELSAMKKAEIESIKAFISQQSDSYRAAYDRHRRDRPRRCSFFATTNSLDFLRDETGNRRFWPLLVQIPYVRLKAEEINQIWAEAVCLYRIGEELYLPKDIEEKAVEQQNNFTIEDPWATAFEAYLDDLYPADWHHRTMEEKQAWLDFPEDPELDKTMKPLDRVTMTELWTICLHGDPRQARMNSAAVAAAMRRVPGWTKSQKKLKVGNVSTHPYVRKSE